MPPVRHKPDMHTQSRIFATNFPKNNQGIARGEKASLGRCKDISMTGEGSTTHPQASRKTEQIHLPRPRRQAAMAAVQRMREWDDLQRSSNSEDDEEAPTVIIENTEDTIICKPYPHLPTHSPLPPPPFPGSHREEEMTSASGRGLMPWKHYTVDDDDDDGDKDYESDMAGASGETYEDEDFEIGSGDDMSEVEEMGWKARKRRKSKSEGKGKGKSPKQVKLQNIQNGQRGRSSGPRDVGHPCHVKATKETKVQKVKDSCLVGGGSVINHQKGHQYQNIKAPFANGSIADSHFPPQSTNAFLPSVGSDHTSKIVAFEDNGIPVFKEPTIPKPSTASEISIFPVDNPMEINLHAIARWERSGADPSDDEPLLSNFPQKKSKNQAKRSAEFKVNKKPRPSEKKPRAGGGGMVNSGGPAETKFRRREIAAMLQSISKEIKWKEVAEEVGNSRRTAGSYASHWKNVLIKNILERYQDDM